MNKSAQAILAVIAGALLIPAGQAAGQSLTNLHWFSMTVSGTNADGAEGLVGEVDGKVFGTAYAGGTGKWGTVFSVNPDGSDFKTLLSFQMTNGAQPNGGLVAVNQRLYGTTAIGGSGGSAVGVVFAINEDGSQFTVVHEFTFRDGTRPGNGSLVESGGVLFGTTSTGGSGNVGTVFRLNLDGTGFTNLHSFNYPDGASPGGGLTLGSNGLYGTTTTGGVGSGTVFRIKPDGTGFSNLYTFSQLSAGANRTNSDGASPQPSPLLVGNTLYIACSKGGLNGYGTLFMLNTDGSGAKAGHQFSGTNDGTYPMALVQQGSRIYGTAGNGGTWDNGTVFFMYPDGTGFGKLHDFARLTPIPQEGGIPQGMLLSDGHQLYGSTVSPSTRGTLFQRREIPGHVGLRMWNGRGGGLGGGNLGTRIISSMRLEPSRAL